MRFQYVHQLACLTLLIAPASTLAKSDDALISASHPFGGSDIKVSARASDGGAIVSLTWNNKEFLNSSDKGRDLQFAWDCNGLGEAFNPTEAGSHDDKGSSRTRFLSERPLSLSVEQGNLLRSSVYPAFWLKTSETSQNVKDDMGARQIHTADLQPVGKATSDDLLETRIRVGPALLPPNVIRFEADITFGQNYRALDLASPTGYLKPEFNTFWRLNPRLNQLSSDSPSNGKLPKGFDYTSDSVLPLIVSTKDQKYAIGIFCDDYTPEQMYLDYSLVTAQGNSPTTFWSINQHYGFTRKGQRTFVSFAAVGTLDNVKDALLSLYRAHQYHLNDPRGYVDVADANHVTGWVYDPRARPGEPLNVDVSTVDDAGNENPIASAIAATGRPDVDTAVNLPPGSCMSFDVPLPQNLRDGRVHYLVTHVTSRDQQVRQFIPYIKAIQGR